MLENVSAKSTRTRVSFGRNVLSLERDMDNLQRLSSDGGVKPQANGGRKIFGLTAHESCVRVVQIDI